MTRRSRQQGLALIYVLLIFSIVAVMATKILSGLWQETKANGLYLEQMQARQYALGAEHYAILILEQDFNSDKDNNRRVDFIGEPWARTILDDSMDQGQLSIRIIDATAGINLNGLLSTDGASGSMEAVFKRLLQNHGVNSELLEKIQDWQDEDQQSRPGGAEDNAYLLEEQAYRTSSGEMVSISELELLDQVDSVTVQSLRPLVAALPADVTVNLNTASPAVLLALTESMTRDGVEAIVEARQERGINGLSELSMIPAITTVLPELKRVNLSYSTQYFQVFTQASYRETDYFLRSLMYRGKDGSVQVVERESGYNQYWRSLNREVVDG